MSAYHRIRGRLIDELGVDPGPELAAAHAALLNGAPASAVGPDRSTGAAIERARPLRAT